MKIGVFASNEYPYPLPSGKIQAALAMAGLIANGLTDLGENVTFFCAQDSKTKAYKKSFGYYSMYYNKTPEKMEGMLPRNHVKTIDIQKMFSDVVAYLQKNPVDILQLHNIREVLPFLQFIPNIPKVLTMNDNPFEYHHNYYLRQYANLSPDINFISISYSQRNALPSDFKFAGNVYNGIKIEQFTFNDKPSNNMIYVGRFIKKKGIDVALKLAVKENKDIVTVGFFPWNEEKTGSFYKEVSSLLDGSNVTNYVKVNHATDIPKLFGSAKVFLFPLDWEEPFGLTLVESMVCGTPVIAYARGAVPEIVKDGETGFIINSSDKDIRGDWVIKKTGIEGMREAIRKMYSLPKEQYLRMRQRCRNHVEQNFTVKVMVSNYQKVYHEIIKDFKNRDKR